MGVVPQLFIEPRRSMVGYVEVYEEAEAVVADTVEDAAEDPAMSLAVT